MTACWEEAQAWWLWFWGCWQSCGHHGERAEVLPWSWALLVAQDLGHGCSACLLAPYPELDGEVVPSASPHPQHVPLPGRGTSGDAEGSQGGCRPQAVSCSSWASGGQGDGMGLVPLAWQVTTGSIVLLSSFPPGPRVHEE